MVSQIAYRNLIQIVSPSPVGDGGYLLIHNDMALADFLLDYALNATAPILRNDLDVNGNTITTSVENGDIAIEPNGTGSIILGPTAWPIGDGSISQVLATNGNGLTYWRSISTQKSVNFTVFKGDGWDNDVIPVWTVPIESSITISQINAAVIGSDTPQLVFNLEERLWGSLNSTGTKIFSSNKTASAAGIELTTFSHATLAAKSYLVLVMPSGPESGSVTSVMVTVTFVQNI